jgi:hypothetical protein
VIDKWIEVLSRSFKQTLFSRQTGMSPGEPHSLRKVRQYFKLFNVCTTWTHNPVQVFPNNSYLYLLTVRSSRWSSPIEKAPTGLRRGVVRNSANQLLAVRVAPRWANSFVRRRPELDTHFQRKYDYQRAQCEDPAIIRGWFTLVRNTIAKYGIHDADIYNFDETGFMMGVISAAMVVSSSDGRVKAKKVQPGNREWVTVVQGVNSQGRAFHRLSLLRVKITLHLGTKTAVFHLAESLKLVGQRMREV